MTLVFCALAFGGAVRWAALGATAGALGSVLPYLNSRRSADQMSPLLVVIAIAIGLTALQLVPLPSSLASIVASQKLELVTDHARAWGIDPPSLVAASYDPPATLVELAKLCGYAALAFAALRIASQPSGRKALGAVVVGVAVAVAVVAFAHEAVGATAIYGVFESPVRDRLVSPIINANHLSSLMALAAPVAIGVGLSSVNALRVMWFGAAILCAAVALLISSRGGALGLGIGLVVTTTLLVLQRRAEDDRHQRMRARSWIPALVIGGCIAVLLAALAGGQVLDEIAATHASDLGSSGSKVGIWEKAAHMLEANPVLGTGRGAFEEAFAQWSEGGGVSYSHAENSYVQPIVDWGIPGAIGLGIAVLALVRRAMRRWLKSPLEAGVLGGLIALAAHEIADFSLELPIVAMVAIVLFAILAPPRLNTAISGGTPPAHRWSRYGALAAGALVCALAATTLGQPAHAAAAAITGTPAERLARATSGSNQHPADYLLLGRAAQALLDLEDPRALAVIDRALAVNPTHFGLHRLAATMLVRLQRPAQAQTELALAVRFAPAGALHEVLEEVVATFPDPEQAARALPLDLDQAAEIVRVLAELHHDRVNLAYTKQLALLNPHDAMAQLLGARAAIAMRQGALAVTMAREAHGLRPDVDSAIVLGSALAIAGNTADGIRTLEEALASGVAQTRPERVRVLTTLADLELASGALAPAAKTFDELVELVDDRAERIAVLTRRAVLHDRLGEPNQARRDRDLAHRLESGDGI